MRIALADRGFARYAFLMARTWLVELDAEVCTSPAASDLGMLPVWNAVRVPGRGRSTNPTLNVRARERQDQCPMCLSIQ